MKLHQEKDWLYQKYNIEKLSSLKIAKICNVHKGTILNWLNVFGIKTRTTSEALKGQRRGSRSEWIKSKISKKLKGHPVSFETRRKMSEAKKGEKHPRWKGGTGYPNYVLMKKMRIKILKEMKNKCGSCRKEAHQIHHIDFSKDNHKRENLMILCPSCHKVIHINHKIEEKVYGKNLSIACR